MPNLYLIVPVLIFGFPAILAVLAYLEERANR